MAQDSELDRVSMIVLRSMRGPIFLLIAVYATGIAGLALIPGQDGAGMSFFHAFYFVTYTATTTGFGELPRAFSEAQRMWAIACLYLSVVAWFYSIGSIIRLVQNPYFRRSLEQFLFARQVRRLSEPFVIVCGFGDTGSLLARGLSDHHMTGVVIDGDPERIKALRLRDYAVKMPGVCADPGVPKQLLAAGLCQPLCQAVVALTNDEDVNMKIAVMARTLNPKVRVVCRSSSRDYSEELRTLGLVSVLDPFETFAGKLCVALHRPALHTLGEWLIGVPGVTLDQRTGCPAGRWLVCGYGRMGRWLEQALGARGVETVVIDPELSATDDGRKLRGFANRQTLLQAGVQKAAGVIAATNRDTVNLRVVLLARALNPAVFVVVRQNRHDNEPAFDAARADLIMQPSLITARHILLQLISPWTVELFRYLESCEPARLETALRRLQVLPAADGPLLWVTELDRASAPALSDPQLCRPVTLADLTRDPSAAAGRLDCVALVLESDRRRQYLPDARCVVRSEDRVLFCGTRRARRLMEATLHSVYTLRYLVTGEEQTRSYLLNWLARR